MDKENEAYLIYDGDCPFCRNYTSFVELSRALPSLRLISARDGGPEIDDAWRRGFDLDKVMVLRIGDDWFAGEQAMAELAGRAKRFKAVNEASRLIFESPQFGRFAYKRLVQGRLLVLRLLGRKRLDAGKYPPL